jgi:Fe2+ or Zn2+ uptake regulation protein
LPIQKSAQISVKILELLKQEQEKTGETKIRATKLLGLCLYNGLSVPSSITYHLNKLIRKGFVQKTVISTQEIYYSLSSLDFDFMISYLKEKEMDNVMSDYDTFKRHVLEWKNHDEFFTLSEIQEYIRNVIHKGITASSFYTYLHRMVDEKHLEKLGYVDKRVKLFGGGTYFYRLVDINNTKDRSITTTTTTPLHYPLIKNIHELFILKLLSESKNKRLKWVDLKSKLEAKYGPISKDMKIYKALANLKLKKQIITMKESNNSIGIYYTLSDRHDFETAFKDFKYGWKKQKQHDRLKGYL